MKAPSHGFMGGEEKGSELTQFVREVSPEADPASVMLFMQILRANSQLTQAAEKGLGVAGLSWAKFRMMMELLRHEKRPTGEGMQPSELSERQGISRNTGSALIASLEQEELISRALHGTDRRKFVIRLTPKGRKVLKSNLTNQFLFVTDCFRGFSEVERETLLRLLIQLNSNLAEKAKPPQGG
ncbi:MAG: MarR family transcriptional regulator [Anaerolineae bacterium]